MLFLMTGDKEFFMGSEPSEVDCAMFGMLVMILWNMPDSKHEKYAKGGCPGRFTGPFYFLSLLCIFLRLLFLYVAIMVFDNSSQSKKIRKRYTFFPHFLPVILVVFLFFFLVLISNSFNFRTFTKFDGVL